MKFVFMKYVNMHDEYANIQFVSNILFNGIWTSTKEIQQIMRNWLQ